MRILEAIEEWKSTICQTSRYKEDLGFIRDMHRLLSYKGYVFPQVRREDAAVLNPSDNLKSAEEMEEEERAAQSAKLQELIRRSGPEDLQEANRLMKIMAGYDTRSKTDYRAKAAEEVGKIQQKARLLEERLEAFRPGETMTEGDVYEELAASLQSAQPKIQKMCEEESDDHEAVAKLFEINDSIHRTVERYKLMKKGDVEAASKIAKGTLGTSTGVSKNADNELSLIDFDAESEINESSSTPAQVPGGLDDDLLGLSMGDSSLSAPSYGQSGAIGLGFGANTGIPGPALMSSQTQNNSARMPTPNATSSSSAQPNYSAFSPFASQPSKPATPQPAINYQPPPPQVQKSVVDPFASLTAPARQATPQQSSTPSLFDFSSNVSSKPQTPTVPTTSADDDEWAFESALPESNGLPSTNTITLTDTAVNVVVEASRRSTSDPVIILSIKYSNKTPMPVTELTFQAAVSKTFNLKMERQTGTALAPLQRGGISQTIFLNGVSYGQGSNVKLRWRLSYKLGGDLKQEQGEVSALGVA